MLLYRVYTINRLAEIGFAPENARHPSQAEALSRPSQCFNKESTC